MTVAAVRWTVAVTMEAAGDRWAGVGANCTMRASSAMAGGLGSPGRDSPRTKPITKIDQITEANTNAMIDLGPPASAMVKMRADLFVTLNSNKKVFGPALTSLHDRLHHEAI